MPAPKLERAKLISDIVGAWIGLIALLIAGGFALVQYLEKAKADRIKVTLDFLDRRARPPIADAHKRMLDHWRQREAELVENARSEQSLKAYVLSVMKSENMYADADQLMDFYENLQVCIANNLCDASTSHALFQQEATRFFRLYYPYIETQMTQQPSYGRSLRSLVVAKSEVQP